MNLFDTKLFKFLGFKNKPKAPWSKYYKESDMNLKIPNISLFEYFYKKSLTYDNLYAMDYYGKKLTYKELNAKILECAKSFKAYGIRVGDIVTICMPNTPEAVIAFLALNKIGAVSNMIHPLSSCNEIKNTLIETRSVMMVLIDIDYDKIKDIIKETELYKVIIVKPNNSMSFFMSLAYKFMGKETKLPCSHLFQTWDNFLKKGKNYIFEKNKIKLGKDTPAVMLHSGGSTGSPKSIVLSNGNFVALVRESKVVFKELKKGDKCLSIMPIFHGFGLGVCIFTPLCLGAECILLPQFKPNDFYKLINKNQPEFVIGVPTLFEALISSNKVKDLNFLKYVIAGGDSLKVSLENKINDFLKNHGANVQILQGYGMSECLAAVALNIKGNIKTNSFGIPFPSIYIGIFDSEDKEVETGKVGEICISGPNVMLGYYNNEKETNIALHIHEDGNVWMHSGDLGYMDENGFFTYTSRKKRMIISSGYNVYPSQIEELLETHPMVMLSSVVGIPHPYKVEVPKAYIVLKKGYFETDKIIEELKELLKNNLPKYAQVYEYEFRKSLPRTLVGKVDFKKLQEENMREREKNEDKI